MQILIPTAVQRALDLLENGGFKGFLVGGCVRDMLLGQEPKDYDIATNATPAQIKFVFSDYKTYRAGRRYGTVGVVITGRPVEITTFRAGGTSSDKADDEFIFADNLQQDLAHRDFTINAMAYHHRQGLVDYFDGQWHLQARQIKAVRNPDQRFREDGLRILRALRFAAVLGFTIEDNTAQSISKNKNLLLKIAPERLGTELCAFICGKYIKPVLLKYFDVLGVIIPEILPAVGFEQHNSYHIYDVWTHTVEVVAATPPLLSVRLAALFHDLGKPATFSMDDNGVGHFYGHGKVSAAIAVATLRKLTIERALIHRVNQLVLQHDTPIMPEVNKVKRWLNKLTEPVLRGLLLIKKADILAQNPIYRDRLKNIEHIGLLVDDIIARGQCFSLANLAVNGHDLMAAGVPKGPAVGRILDYLLGTVLEGKLPNDKETLLKAARLQN